MLLEWSNGQVTVECSKSLADEKAMEQYLIGPGVHNHVMLHTMHQLSLLETQVTAAMVRQWRARLKRFLLRVPDAARASFHCSHTCLFWMPPAQRATVIDSAAAAIHEALEIRLNPGFFHETSVKYFKLQLTPLEYYAIFGPLIGHSVVYSIPKNSSNRVAVACHRFTTATSLRLLLRREVVAKYKEAANEEAVWICKLQLEHTQGLR